MPRGAEHCGQRPFLHIDYRELGATHEIKVGAYIEVHKKTGPDYAPCTVLTPFDVHMFTHKEEVESGVNRRGLGFCVAKEDFWVHYEPNYHNGRPKMDVEYCAGTHLYAFRNPEDGKVEKIPGGK